MHADGILTRVAEFGVGFYSTPILSALGVPSYHYENIESWRTKVQELVQLSIHPLDVDNPPVVPGEGGLCFMDSAPESSRVKLLQHYKYDFRVFVVHDTNPDWDAAYGYSKLAGVFPRVYHYDGLRPHTTVFSHVPLCLPYGCPLHLKG
jgi:hypothetical protein